MFYNAKLFATRLYFILILSHFKWPKSSFACWHQRTNLKDNIIVLTVSLIKSFPEKIIYSRFTATTHEISNQGKNS